MNTKKEAVAFCQAINQLIEFGEKLAKRNSMYLAEIIKLRDRMTLFTSTQPVNYVIELLGPYFFQYRERIAAREEQFFMRGDFIDEVNIPSGERRDTISHFTSVLAQMYNSADLRERDFVYNKCLTLLRCYVNYAASAH